MQTDPTTPDPGACARCAEKFSTCCVISPSSIECCFPLSAEERQAITDHTGSDRGMTRAPNSRVFVRSLQDLFPGEHVRVAALFPEWEFHWHLGVNEKGACVFLGERGCTLPRAVRPAYCRLFPFWVHKGEIWHFALSDCQALRESLNLTGLRRLFELSDEDIFRLYLTVRKGWGLPQKGGNTPRGRRQGLPSL